MKNLFPILSLLGFMGLLLSACNKDQSAVNDLSGTWKITRLVDNGVDLTAVLPTIPAERYIFEKCDLGTLVYCTMIHTFPTYADTSRYRITNGGKTLEIKNGTTITPCTIKSQTATTFEFSYQDAPDNYDVSLEKL